MKIFKSRFIIFVLFMFIILSEIVILNQNFSLKKKISGYHHVERLLIEIQEQLEKINNIDSLEGLCLPYKQQIKEQIRKINETRNSKYIIAFYFSLLDCIPCIESEIATWNSFEAENKPEFCQLIGFIDSVKNVSLNEIRSIYRIGFPIYYASNLNDTLAKYGIDKTPVVLFCDGETKKILHAHFPIIKDLSKDRFVKRLRMMLDECE